MYSQKVMNHFLHPRNVGMLDAGIGVGSGAAENPDCGDTAIVDVQVADGRITAARFRSTGCAGAIACCSAVTEWLTGRSVAESAGVDAAAVESHLGGLPAAKRGCAEMAAAAARAAVAAATDSGS